MNVKKIYLIRHAKPEYPGGKRTCLGQKMDVPLSIEGHEQAKRLAGTFETRDIEAVYCSPLLRARQTAQYVAAGKRPIRNVDGFMELDGGEWDGLPFEEIHTKYAAYFVPGAAVPPPPGGESDEQGLSRARQALNQIAEEIKDSAAIISHSGLNRVLLTALMDRPLHLKKKVPQEYACVSILCCEQGNWNVEEVGTTLEEWENR